MVCWQLRGLPIANFYDGSEYCTKAVTPLCGHFASRTYSFMLLVLSKKFKKLIK